MYFVFCSGVPISAMGPMARSFTKEEVAAPLSTHAVSYVTSDIARLRGPSKRPPQSALSVAAVMPEASNASKSDCFSGVHSCVKR